VRTETHQKENGNRVDEGLRCSFGENGEKCGSEVIYLRKKKGRREHLRNCGFVLCDVS